MFCERSSRLMLLDLLECWERRIGFRLDLFFRAFDPVKEITRRLFPNDHLEARLFPVTSHRSLVLAVHALAGFGTLAGFKTEGLRFPTRGV